MKDDKVILFDCFGLFASDSVDDFFKDHYPENHQELKDSFCEEGDSGAFDFDTLLENMAKGLSLNQAALTEEINRRRVLYPRMIELAKRLRESHRVYLLSNCIRGVIESIFEGTGFEDCFDGQIRSCDIGLVKPKPEIFAYAKKALGNPLLRRQPHQRGGREKRRHRILCLSLPRASRGDPPPNRVLIRGYCLFFFLSSNSKAPALKPSPRASRRRGKVWLSEERPPLRELTWKMLSGVTDS